MSKRGISRYDIARLSAPEPSSTRPATLEEIGFWLLLDDVPLEQAHAVALLVSKVDHLTMDEPAAASRQRILGFVLEMKERGVGDHVRQAVDAAKAD